MSRFGVRHAILGVIWLIALTGVVIMVHPPAVIESLAVPIFGAAATSVASFLLLAEWNLTTWLRASAGRAAGPGDFLRERAGKLAMSAMVPAGCAFLYLGVFVPFPGSAPIVFLATGGLLLTLSGVTGLVGILHQPRTKKDELEELGSRIEIKPFAKQRAEALDFQKICGTRLALPILQIVLLGGAAIAASFLACLGLIKLGDWGFPLADPLKWPGSFKMAIFFGLFSVSCIGATTILTLFRVTQRMRRVGRLKRGEVAHEFGVALETVGILGTVGAGTLLTIALLVILLVSFGVREILLQSLPSVIAALIQLTVFLSLTWSMVLFPGMYLFPIMTRRDCGWMKGFGASIQLVRLEGRIALVRFLIATGAALTLVGVPAALAILLAGLDGQDVMLAAILREKSKKELDQALTEEEAGRPAALEKPYKLLEAGRYLDALNGFQMYLRHNRDDLHAIRGESLAMLYMGNLRARESLERWERLEPGNPEAAQLLREFAEGLWKDNGRLFKAADAKCTQRIGRGV